MSRRHLLKRGVQVGAVAAWTIPIVQVVSMTPAHADSTSTPAKGSGSGTGGKTSTKTDPTSSSATATGTKPSTDLPFTGASVVPAAVVGAGALAVGAGLIAATARKRSTEADENPTA